MAQAAAAAAEPPAEAESANPPGSEKSSSLFFKRVFWAGLTLRLAVAPFLKQWYHADERQLLEFAHFHAHGQLHPFLEAELQMRNQTAPWLLSFPIRALDALGLGSPGAYEWVIHAILGVWGWIGLWALVNWVRESLPDGHRAARGFAVAAAVFWAFPLLFSRGLSESLSFAPAAWTWYFLSRPVSVSGSVLAGIAAGVTSFLRYPSGLFAVGGFLVGGGAGAGNARARGRNWYIAGALCALGLGGILDSVIYGGWLTSLFKYWEFNRPGGRVTVLFGDDSLAVYYHLFDFLFSPLMAPLALVAMLVVLARSRRMLVFVLPYLLAHLSIGHREPRFLLPLVPFAMAAFFVEIAARFKRPVPRAVSVSFVGLNLVWLAFQCVMQLQSSQAAVTGTLWAESVVDGRPWVSVSEPLIDVFVPPKTAWAYKDSTGRCGFYRPAPADVFFDSGYFLITDEVGLSGTTHPGCERIVDRSFLTDDRPGTHLKRLARVRVSEIWKCGPDSKSLLMRYCPGGVRPAPPGFPFRGERVVGVDATVRE